MADISQYLNLITSEHADKPKFVATVSALVQPFADEIDVIDHLIIDFDLDAAIGVQLDAVGVRVGRSRYLVEPVNAFFSFGIDGLGFGQGVWKGPFDPVTGVVRLPDDTYRMLLRAVIIANQWDGTINGAYDAWNTILGYSGFGILIQDYGDMTMAIVLIGRPPDALTRALFTTGELDLKPATVRLRHALPSDYTRPIFGFGAMNEHVAGFGVGAWANFISSE